MASPAKIRSVSQSRAVVPVRSTWKSFQIRWGLPGLKELEGRTAHPLVRLNPPKNFDTSRYLNTFSLSPGVDLNKPESLPKQKQLAEMKKTGVVESWARLKVDLPKVRGSQNDALSTENSKYGVRRFETERRKFLQKTRGVLCTEVEQWVVVEVDVVDATAPAPSLHLWAFLQPARIGGNAKILAADSQQTQDDCPRSGWAEYLLEPAAGRATAMDWNDATRHDVPLTSRDWVCKKLDTAKRGAAATWAFKLRVVVRNQKTSGDADREKASEKTKIPEKDFEAGCWLKVWVRDPHAGFTKAPQDDESDAVMKSMDAQSARRPEFDFQAMLPYTVGCHGFVRERLLDGTNTQSEGEANPVYVLLFSQGSMDDLVALDKQLKEMGPGKGRLAASIGATSAATLLIGFSLRKILENWKNPPGGNAGTPEQQALLSREKGQFLIELLESYQVANTLAAYGADGFRHVGPGGALEGASKSNPEILQILSHLYGQVFDFCLVDGPSHYRDYAQKRIENRQKLLDSQIRWSAEHKARAAAHQQNEAEAKAARRKQMAKQLENLGLGLANKAKERAEAKKNAKGLSRGVKPSLSLDKCSVKATLLEGGKTWSFPKPFGAPLPIPGVPLVWRIDIAVEGSVGATLSVVPPPDDKGAWEFGLEFKGDGKLEIAAGIHALWSSMDGALPGGDAEQKELKSEFERNKQDLRDLRRAALERPAAPKTEIVRLLHSLMKYASLDIAVNLGLKVESVLGFKVSYNHHTGEIAHQWVGVDGKPTGAGANLSLDAHLQFSVVTLDYNLAGLPHLARANTQELSVDFSGQVLGQTWTKEPIKIEWGSGKLYERIAKNDESEYLIWGRASQFQLKYESLKKPEIKFDLVRKPGSASKSVGSIPATAVKCKDQGEGGVCEVTLQLTCRKTAPGGLTPVGSWSLGEQVKILGGSHDFGPKTEAGQWLHDILHTNHPNMVLRGTYLESTQRFSQSFFIPTPRLAAPTRAEWAGNAVHSQLHVQVRLAYFEDTHIWLRLRDDHHRDVPSKLGEAWQCLRIKSPQNTATGLVGFVVPEFSRLDFRGKAFSIDLSLIPSEEGILRVC